MEEQKRMQHIWGKLWQLWRSSRLLHRHYSIIFIQHLEIPRERESEWFMLGDSFHFEMSVYQQGIYIYIYIYQCILKLYIRNLQMYLFQMPVVIKAYKISSSFIYIYIYFLLVHWNSNIVVVESPYKHSVTTLSLSFHGYLHWSKHTQTHTLVSI